MKVFKIISPGSLTTVQDTGRSGYQRLGIPLSGALDSDAANMANLLVGNATDWAVMEMTLMGPQLEVLSRADIAVTGAKMDFQLNGKKKSPWCSIRVQKGDRLDFGTAESGCRAYLAVTGGIDVPLVMGSRSTYIAGQIGGINGRAIQAGDTLRRGDGLLNVKPLRMPQKYRPRYSKEIVLRVIPGPQNDFFDEGLDVLLKNPYTVTSDADRMGYRLSGPEVMPKPDMPPSIISEPSLPGGIQIPADHQPIILLVEQTVGGYAKIATVISTDLSRVAQATPADQIRFRAVNLETAHALFREKRSELEQLAAWLTSQTAPVCC
jgi:biotin-dependent carboxylase-like uncharacterized protein